MAVQKILVVDDEARMRKLVSDFLTREGYEVLEAGDGEAAMDLFYAEKDIVLIILDVMMPKMDGWQVVREIRESSQVPVIMLTARADERDELKGFDLGVDEYVTKPFSTKLLLAKVNALIKRYRGLLVKDGRIIIDELVIEPFKRVVSVDGKRLDISPREYELLMYFVENKEHVLSRDQILDAVWGQDFIGYDRAVDTYVKKLRQTLGPASRHIETVIKSGYIWRN